MTPAPFCAMCSVHNLRYLLEKKASMYAPGLERKEPNVQPRAADVKSQAYYRKQQTAADSHA